MATVADRRAKFAAAKQERDSRLKPWSVHDKMPGNPNPMGRMQQDIQGDTPTGIPDHNYFVGRKRY